MGSDFLFSEKSAGKCESLSADCRMERKMRAGMGAGRYNT